MIDSCSNGVVVPQKKRIGFESNLNRSIFYRIGRTRINLEQIQCHIGTETGRFFLLKKVLGFGAEERLVKYGEWVEVTFPW